MFCLGLKCLNIWSDNWRFDKEEAEQTTECVAKGEGIWNRPKIKILNIILKTLFVRQGIVVYDTKTNHHQASYTKSDIRCILHKTWAQRMSTQLINGSKKLLSDKCKNIMKNKNIKRHIDELFRNGIHSTVVYSQHLWKHSWQYQWFK